MTTNGDPNATYTGALQQVLHQLGRLDGKLDAFDNRLRIIENEQAAAKVRQDEGLRLYGEWTQWRKDVDIFIDSIGKKLAAWGGGLAVVGLTAGYFAERLFG